MRLYIAGFSQVYFCLQLPALWIIDETLTEGSTSISATEVTYRLVPLRSTKVWSIFATIITVLAFTLLVIMLLFIILRVALGVLTIMFILFIVRRLIDF